MKLSAEPRSFGSGLELNRRGAGRPFMGNISLLCVSQTSGSNEGWSTGSRPDHDLCDSLLSKEDGTVSNRPQTSGGNPDVG